MEVWGSSEGHEKSRGNMARTSILLPRHGFLLTQPLENFTLGMSKSSLGTWGEYRWPPSEAVRGAAWEALATFPAPSPRLSYLAISSHANQNQAQPMNILYSPKELIF